MVFEHKLSLIQLLLPGVCFGIQIGGLLLYVYMSWIYKSKLYLGIACLIVFGMLFVGSESMILSFGSWLHNRAVALQFHRLEQIAGAFFLFSLPLSLKYFVKLNRRWQFFNTIIIFSGLAFSLIVTVFAFTLPDTFISMTREKTTWLLYEADFGRGQEGPLYLVRDMLLGMTIPYCIISLIIDMKKYKTVEYQIYPVIGLCIVLFGAAIDMIHVYTNKYYDFLPEHNFSRVSASATFALLFFIFSVTKKFIKAAKELEKANKVISTSEEKYRFLVEGTDECIFSMNRELKIIKANKAALRHLCIDSSFSRTNFYDLLFIDHDEDNLSIQLVREKLELLFTEGGALDFKVFFKTKGTMEPREYNVKIEIVNKEEANEILVKASSIMEDIIMKYLDKENLQLKIDNYLIAAEEISTRLVLNLSKHMNHSSVNNVKIGLREIIINAIEHGNLNVTFEEKSMINDNGNYIEFILDRQNNPVLRKKKVFINYLLDKDHVEYTIQDQGKGFNYREILKYIKKNVDQDMLEHGRGLRMAHNIFDEVKFNKRGNKVTLVKFF